MNTQDVIIIPLSKTRISWFFIGSLFFTALGIWFITAPPEIRHPLLGNSTLIFVAGLSSLLLFGIMSVLYAVKLFQKAPGLIIDQAGITDNASGISAGLIRWEDLEKISVMELRKQKLLMLYVHNPQYYIERQRNGIKRKIMQINYNSFATPISISTNGLRCKFEELHTVLKHYMAKSRL